VEFLPVIVNGSTLSFALSHDFAACHERSERLLAWQGRRPPSDRPAPAQPATDTWQRSPSARAEVGYSRATVQAKQAHLESPLSADGPGDDPRLDGKQAQIVALLERIFGVKGIKQFSLDLDYSQAQAVQASAQAAQTAQSGDGGAGWGAEYDYHEAYSEHEQTSLALAGTFTTADGRAFSFSLDYRLERTYTRTTDIHVRAGDAKLTDPLVLDFGGAGGLDQATTGLDLDGDGVAEQAHRLNPGQYFLVNDRNGNGVVDSGRELFGTKSGNGFYDLAELDQDHSGFVDAGDAGFAHLRLWNGVDAQPLLLAAFKVAAIGIDSIAAPFSYKDAQNHLLGENRRLGVYLTDDGKAGAVKQVDLVV
jgi:hypothetical protein